MNRIILLIALVILGACSSKPKLYANKYYKKVGQKQAGTDIDQCMEDAKIALKGNKSKQVGKSTGFGAVLGGAVGAIGGILMVTY